MSFSLHSLPLLISPIYHFLLYFHFHFKFLRTFLIKYFLDTFLNFLHFLLFFFSNLNFHPLFYFIHLNFIHFLLNLFLYLILNLRIYSSLFLSENEFINLNCRSLRNYHHLIQYLLFSPTFLFIIKN
jgi:hypothetical protein